MIVLRIVGSLRVIAELATSAKDAIARALKADIGEVRSVGRRFGRIMLDRAWSVRRVRSAESAFCASSSERRRLSR
jgi:hypothetical protein